MYSAISIHIPHSRPDFEFLLQRNNYGDILISCDDHGEPWLDAPLVVTLREAAAIAEAIKFLVNIDAEMFTVAEA
jgi:hypothetical protein